MNEGFMDLVQYLISADLRMAAPILIAALGLLVMEKSGVLNIGCEGMMLMGSFVAVYFARVFGNPWSGLLFAGLSGMIVGVFYALIVVYLRANQIVTGISFNLIILGLTSTLNRLVFGVSGQAARAPGFEKITLAPFNEIPVIGSFFDLQGPVYLILLSVPLFTYFFQKTTVGLKIRSVGEYPYAADAAGINVVQVRLWSILGGSFLIAAAGGFLSLGVLSLFTENMVSGRGYIAMAAVIFGNWNPWGVLLATLVFGMGEAVQIKLQTANSGIPYQLLMMIPYILTILALSGFVGRSNAPTSSGKPFKSL